MQKRKNKIYMHYTRTAFTLTEQNMCICKRNDTLRCDGMTKPSKQLGRHEHAKERPKTCALSRRLLFMVTIIY